MKKIILPALLLGISGFVFAQGEQEPCCNVISVDATTNHVIARDKVTGKLHQFKADAMDARSIQKNDAVSISGGMVTSIGGAKRTYANVRIAYGEPCCGVVSIQPDPVEPCCGIVTYSVKGTNELNKFRAPKSITNTIRVGDPVYAEPASKPKSVSSVAGMSSSLSGMAVVYSNDSDGLSAFGYPIESSDGSASGSGTSNAMWKKWANNQKGVLGRFVFSNLPKDAQWQIDVYREPDNKFLQTYYSEHTREFSLPLSPGSYTIKLMHAPVENVPIERGNDTELKFGLLKVESEGQWDVYMGTKYLFTRNKPGKVVLPPGAYRLKLGGEEYSLVIKEGKTEEY